MLYMSSNKRFILDNTVIAVSLLQLSGIWVCEADVLLLLSELAGNERLEVGWDAF